VGTQQKLCSVFWVCPSLAMEDWHKLKPDLFKKLPYYRPDVTSREY